MCVEVQQEQNHAKAEKQRKEAKIMNIENFNKILGAITHKYIGYELHDNSAIYYGIYNGLRVKVKFENLGLDRYITMNGKTYYNCKLGNEVGEVI